MEVIPFNGRVEYLGRTLGFEDFYDYEIDSRFAKTWRKFYSFRYELCCKDFPLRDRMRLFVSVITHTLLYGSASWTMTRAREQKIQVAQRRMLRKMCQTRRLAAETWVEWVPRVTAQRRCKWRWAGRVARHTTTRWTNLAIKCRPALHDLRACNRPQARPHKLLCSQRE